MKPLDNSGSAGARATAAAHTPRRLPVNPRRHKVAPEHRKRVATACNACNVRRVRCSGEHPCRQCQSSSRDCIYPLPVEKVSVTRSELEELKHKVDLYERALRDTVPGAVSNAAADATSRQEVFELLGYTASSRDAGSAAASQGQAARTTPTVDGLPQGMRVPSELPQLQYSNVHRQYQSQPQAQPQTQLPDTRLQDNNLGLPRSFPLQIPHPVVASHHRHDDEEDVLSTEGRLLHDPDGNARFLGETSGATFLDYLKEFMTTVLPLAYQNLRPGSDGSAFLSSLGRYQTYDSRPLHDRDVDPSWFPTPPEMDSMLSELRYFIQDGNGSWPSGGIYWWGNLSSAPAIPLMERDSPIVRLAKCRPLAFYQTAFAVVSQATIMPPQDISIDSNLSENYYSRARMLLGNPLDITRFTPSEVAALTLMGFYLIEMNRRDAAYMCVSSAMHISIMHGAHRGWLDESGKRVFWTLYVLDRYLSCLMGRSPTIMDDAIRLPLPYEAPSMPPADGLRAHVELSRISSHIVCNTYRISPSDDARPVRNLEADIGMLDDWSLNLPATVQLSNNGLSDDPATCLLHMHYNQLIILTIRPVFFAAVKKSFAEKLVSRQCSLSSHPQLHQLKRCISSAEHNIQLARQILTVNHPRKLLQAGLHFIFNAAIVLMLQHLIENLCPSSRSEKARSLDLDFVIARFEDESRVGSNYGRDCATVLRDLRVLVQRLPIPVDMNAAARPVTMAQQPSTTYDPIANRTTVDMGQQWSEKLTSEALQQPALVEQGHMLYNELVSWIDVDWQSYNGYLI
ncbi:hypothetical protein NW762_002249 [Fusarium torreyae]|uniref:Zn(2)-C6 fungal-type domain-containing protein n=1 Tax=Fusarium torreyae TaxID=1237075 RepID=A0A9W8VLX8_9HYPO|nr:hypothetical protein NW762_002249 [Fusarium torreyae]